jgi:hypothetical protein
MPIFGGFGNLEKVSRLIKISVLFLVLALFMLPFEAQAQNKRRVVQLSGMVLGDDSLNTGLPGVHVYVPKAGRGTTTNPLGYFSMPVLVGDSVVISSVGFVRRHYIVPGSPNDYITIIVEMVPDVTYLKEVEILPFPTEEVFKEAVLALNIPMDNGVDQKNLNAELLALMVRTTPMDGAANYRYYMNQYSSSFSDRFQPRTNPYLNPFNWARFFRDLKNNKKK